MPPIENIVLFVIVLLFVGWFFHSLVNMPVPMHEDEAFFEKWDEMLNESERVDVLLKNLFVSVDVFYNYWHSHMTTSNFNDAAQIIEKIEGANKLFEEVAINMDALKRVGYHLPRYYITLPPIQL